MDKPRPTSKGQVTLPKSIRDSRGWSEGTALVVEGHQDGILLRPSRPFQTTTLDDVYAIAGYRGKPLSIAAIDRAIASKVKARANRGRH